MVYRLILLLVILNTATAKAQISVPLDSTMRMFITARDTDLLAVYNIYTAEIGEGVDKLSADFLVVKNEDTFSHKSYILGQLTRVTDFTLMPDPENKGRGVLHDLDGIEIHTKKGLNKQAYLNFDPMLPDPVFMLRMDAREKAK